MARGMMSLADANIAQPHPLDRVATLSSLRPIVTIAFLQRHIGTVGVPMVHLNVPRRSRYGCILTHPCRRRTTMSTRRWAAALELVTRFWIGSALKGRSLKFGKFF